MQFLVYVEKRGGKRFRNNAEPESRCSQNAQVGRKRGQRDRS